jgi:hypothetical protein
MTASPHAGKHQCASGNNSIKIITAFSCRISVLNGVAGIVSHDMFRPTAARRAWMVSIHFSKTVNAKGGHDRKFQ